MERLTYRPEKPFISRTSGEHIEAFCDHDVREIIHRLADYEDTGLTPEDITKVQESLNSIPFGRFYEIMQAEREGRLVVLPCKVGDTVYRIISYKCNAVCNKLNACNSFIYKGCKQAEFYVCSGTFQLNDMWWIGKTVFLTREEAEAALKGEKQ